MTRHPWLKFYPSDWQADQQLRICSLAARGLWIECMAIMHRADPYGHLNINGRPPTDAQLATLVGALPDQIPMLMDELENAGVFSRTRNRVIYSRRMTRDEKRRKDGEAAAQGGRIRGSRRHKQAPETSTENLPPPRGDKGVVGVPPSPQKPEARSQIDDADKQHHLAGDAPDDGDVAMAKPVEVGRRVAEIFGLADDPKWLGSYAVAMGWLAAGYDPELDIYPLAREIAERCRRQRKSMPGSLNYLTKALNGRAKSLKADVGLIEQMPKPELVIIRPKTQQWKAWLAHYRAKGQKTVLMEKSETWTVPTEWPPDHDSSIPLDTFPDRERAA